MHTKPDTRNHRVQSTQAHDMASQTLYNVGLDSAQPSSRAATVGPRDRQPDNQTPRSMDYKPALSLEFERDALAVWPRESRTDFLLNKNWRSDTLASCASTVARRNRVNMLRVLCERYAHWIRRAATIFSDFLTRMSRCTRSPTSKCCKGNRSTTDTYQQGASKS